MAHKFDPHRKDLLDCPDRLHWQNPATILPSFGLKQGMAIADIGCGTGFFSFPAAEIVGVHGKVYAIDLQPEMLEEVKKRLREGQNWNIEPVLSTEERIPLPPKIVDAALMVNVLHELYGDATLAEIRRLLKDGGILAVVDWKKIEMEMGPPVEHRLSEEEAQRRLAACGFLLERMVGVGPYHYGLKAVKEGS